MLPAVVPHDVAAGLLEIGQSIHAAFDLTHDAGGNRRGVFHNLVPSFGVIVSTAGVCRPRLKDSIGTVSVKPKIISAVFAWIVTIGGSVDSW
jgi:hypothetical protein